MKDSQWKPYSLFSEQDFVNLENADQNIIISNQEFEYLICIHPVCPVLYSLPKVYMPKTRQNNCAAGIASLLESLSNFVKTYVQPLPFHIRDYIDFIGRYYHQTQHFPWI